MVSVESLKQMYADGVNLIRYLIDVEQMEKTDAIRISYDIQAGSYTERYNRDGESKRAYCKKLALLINELDACDSVMIAGVGEAITLCCTIPHLKHPPSQIYGFDISWSRIKYAREFCRQQQLEDVELFVANMLRIPLKDNSIDLVITNHSLEPNGGYEKPMLAELSRVANKYLLMNEPSYEFGDADVKKRMETHGYVKHLAKHAAELELRVTRNELFGLSLNPMNPTGNTIVELFQQPSRSASPEFQCPVSGLPLTKTGDSFWGSGGCAYPIVDGIPCFLPENAILATHYAVSPARRNEV